MIWFAICFAVVYFGVGALLASFGVSAGEPFHLRTVYAWPLVLLGW